MVIRTATRVLAIDPGTKEMGFAVLQGHALVDQGVKAIKKGRPVQETLTRGLELVAGLIEDFRPETFVIEETLIGRNRSAALLNIFADKIQALAKRQGLRVLSFAPSAVKKAVCGHGWATKAEVAKAVVAHYPELRAY